LPTNLSRHIRHPNRAPIFARLQFVTPPVDLFDVPIFGGASYLALTESLKPAFFAHRGEADGAQFKR
jgi:hypothetical protein